MKITSSISGEEQANNFIRSHFDDVWGTTDLREQIHLK